MPLTVVAVSVPCKVPVPVPRAAVTTRPLVVMKLPAESCAAITGCCAKATPAVAAEDGCVLITSFDAGPISISRAQLVVFVPAGTVAEPLFVMLPLANGLLAVGRTRTFCHVSELVTPPLEEFEIVNVICVVVRDVIAAAVPLATLLMFLLSLPPPPVRVTTTVGAVPPVSKMNPLGTLRTMVLLPVVPTSPVFASQYVGPVSVV